MTLRSWGRDPAAGPGSRPGSGDSLAGDAATAVLRKVRDEVEPGDEAPDPREIPLVRGDQCDAALAAGHGEDDVVRERLPDVGQDEPLRLHHRREDETRLLPRGRCRGEHSARSLKTAEQLTAERRGSLRRAGAGQELVGDDGAQLLKRGVGLMESLKARGDVRVAKAVEKDVGIERVLGAARGWRRLHARPWTGHVALLAIPGGGKQRLVAIEW
jgi:hypothetical protein